MKKSLDVGIYINLKTLEGKELCSFLDGSGFRIVGESFDSCENEDSEKVYETIYALIQCHSPAYTQSFGNALVDKLNELSWILFLVSFIIFYSEKKNSKGTKQKRKFLHQKSSHENWLRFGFQISQLFDDGNELLNMISISCTSVSSLLTVHNFSIEFVHWNLDVVLNLRDGTPQMFFNFCQILKLYVRF